MRARSTFFFSLASRPIRPARTSRAPARVRLAEHFILISSRTPPAPSPRLSLEVSPPLNLLYCAAAALRAEGHAQWWCSGTTLESLVASAISGMTSAHGLW